MLVEYKGKRFRISERTYECFERDFPERADCLKIIKESEEYYNYDKLNQTIEPQNNEVKEVIIKNYIYADDKYEDILNDYCLGESMNCDDMEKYFGAKEMARKIGIELLNYDPEHDSNREEVNKYRQKIKEKEEDLKRFNEQLKEMRF